MMLDEIHHEFFLIEVWFWSNAKNYVRQLLRMIIPHKNYLNQ